MSESNRATWLDKVLLHPDLCGIMAGMLLAAFVTGSAFVYQGVARHTEATVELEKIRWIRDNPEGWIQVREATMARRERSEQSRLEVLRDAVDKIGETDNDDAAFHIRHMSERIIAVNKLAEAETDSPLE